MIFLILNVFFIIYALVMLLYKILSTSEIKRNKIQLEKEFLGHENFT